MRGRQPKAWWRCWRIEPARLGNVLRGELDWIAMKALEKDRARRYETASKLAEDVQHFLNDEPVAACPPSSSYKLRKFVRLRSVRSLQQSSSRELRPKDRTR